MLLASDMCDVGVLRGDTPHQFHVAANLEHAAALSMTAGLDQELCNPTDGRGQAGVRPPLVVNSLVVAMVVVGWRW